MSSGKDEAEPELTDDQLVAASIKYEETQSKGYKFVEVKGDLFACPATHSLAHCISEDCHMGKGIAVLFKQKFGRVDQLLKQGQKPGGCAVLKDGNRYIYYLVTKKRYFHKPTYGTLRGSLEKMRDHCEEHDVTHVAIPKIGCGLDKLQWSEVRKVIDSLFKDTNVQFTMFYI